MSAAGSNQTGRRVAFAPNWGARLGWLLLALYVLYAGSQLGFSAERFSAGIEHGHLWSGCSRQISDAGN